MIKTIPYRHMDAYFLLKAHINKAILTIASLLLLASSVVAQKATFEFFSTDNGLAGNHTSSVTQDDQGFIWFINDGKIHRYDGYNFLIYPTPDVLTAKQEYISGLTLYQDSLLFVWSEHHQFLFNPKKEHWQPINLKVKNTLGGRLRFWPIDGQNTRLMTKVEVMSQRAWSCKIDKSGTIGGTQYPDLLSAYYWRNINDYDYSLTYEDTVYHINKAGKITTATPLDNVCKNCGDMWFQPYMKGSVALLSNTLFYQLDKSKNKFLPHAVNRLLKPNKIKIRRFITEKNGSIWACGYDRSLIYYDARADKLYNFHEELKQLLPNNNDFLGLFQDNTGIVWVETRLGLLKVRPWPNPFDTYFSGMNNVNANYSFRGLTEDAQGMMYGVYYTGIAKFDPVKKQTLRTYLFPGTVKLYDLYTDGDIIWVNGFQALEPNSGKIIEVPSPFKKKILDDNGFFTKDKYGTLWWITHYTLYRLNKANNQIKWEKEFDLPDKLLNTTEALHAGMKSGKIWLSFKGRLLQYDPKTKVQQWYDPKTWRLPISRILAIEEDSKGNLWLGTDAGLVWVNPFNGSHRQYTISEGLPNNFISGMLMEGDSCLWLSTNHGLSRFHLPTKVFNNFLEEDGLTFNEFNRKSFFKAKNGRMFFGGMRGVNAFFPKDLMQSYITRVDRNQKAKLVLTALEYTDEKRDTVLRKTSFASQPEIHFNDWDWSYTFEYTLTDYDNPKEVFYSYKIDGYKDSWSSPSKFNFAHFNSLPSGEYTLRVKARDSRGRWRSNEMAVKIIVYPPWWASWWAYTIYIVLFSAFCLVMYNILKKRLILQNELKMKQQEAQRLKELDLFKNRLYTNLTHEFRTPLTVILGMVDQIRNQPEKYLEEGARLIQTNGENLLRLINQLLDLSKLSDNSFQLHFQQADIVSYLRYLTDSFQAYANSQNLSLRFFSALNIRVMDYDEEQIKQILTNLISNAIKFTPSGGEITIRLKQEDNRLSIEVQDTGIGIAKKELTYIFERFYQIDNSHTRQREGTGIGLAHAHEMIKLMNGEVFVESELGKGTTFIVKLPITNKAPIVAGPPKSEKYISSVNFMNRESITSISSSAIDNSLPHLLIIEDNADLVIFLKTCLYGLYQLDVAYNGIVGIEKAIEHTPDIIISDVMMPGKDGYQVCETLKSDQRTSHIPIILLTAKVDTDSKITGLKHGADVYMAKPFNKEELVVQLEMLVQKQKRLQAYFSQNSPIEKVINIDIVTEDLPEEIYEREHAFVKKVTSIVHGNFADENFGLSQLCQEIGMSRSQLFRKMKTLIGVSPSDFIRSYRLAQAKIMLETSSFNISEVAWKTGYKNAGHFSTSFQEEFGFSPSAMNK
ncbi:ATP-binding protein [Arcicella aquatica]|uniref:histidine kinase n=1 Tax=Arcicella aquatica TaxID=217141 RepID=A0ABU5QMM7_9BACT|nr:ATP-binding protein [Arcicella aquatica]MEA5258119.1 ATP-binding protein [Arcicella aquatica]